MVPPTPQTRVVGAATGKSDSLLCFWHSQGVRGEGEGCTQGLGFVERTVWGINVLKPQLRGLKSEQQEAQLRHGQVTLSPIRAMNRGQELLSILCLASSCHGRVQLACFARTRLNIV
jgi:hypothetical protein